MSAKRFLFTSILSIIAGWINGFLGGGGGVLTVTLLLTVYQLPQKNSQATAMAIILPVTAVSAFVYILKNKIPWQILGLTSLGVAVGGVLGALLLNKLKGNSTKLIFALFLLLGGIKMLMGV